MSKNKSKQVVHGLWIGKTIPPIGVLCMKSFIDNGYEFNLWLYDTLNILLPKEVVERDANEIIPSKDVFCYQDGINKGSYAGFSDIFRAKLLFLQGGIYTDLDVTSLQSFDIEEEYLFRYNKAIGCMGNFMKAPKGAPIMEKYYNDLIKVVNSKNSLWQLPIELLYKNICDFNLTNYIKDISHEDNINVVYPYLRENKPFPKEWKIVHWCNESFRLNNINHYSFPTNSTINQLFNQYKVYKHFSLLQRFKANLKFFKEKTIFNIKHFVNRNHLLFISITLFFFKIFSPFLNKKSIKKENFKKILIIGWYGTETAGDKLILKNILSNLFQINKSCECDISSSNVKYTQQTLQEIGYNNVGVIISSIKSLIPKIKNYDYIIIGGGPLMEDIEIYRWLLVFIKAKFHKIPTIIWGCGIATIHSSRIKKIITLLGTYSDLIMVRDKESLLYLPKKTHSKTYITADPAIGNEIEVCSKKEFSVENLEIGVVIRTWHQNYFNLKNKNSFDVETKKYHNELIKMITELNSIYKPVFHFFPMHILYNENDVQLMEQLFKNIKFNKVPIYHKNITSPHNILNIYQQFDFLIGMRFHSIIFSIISNKPFIGIDYDAQKGKIFRLCNRIGFDKQVINILDFTSDKIIQKIDFIINNYSQLQNDLFNENQKLKEFESKNKFYFEQFLHPN